MMRQQWRLATVIAAIATTGVAYSQGPGAEWPQYLGPSRNGIARTQIAPGSKLTVAWKQPLPAGGAGIVVAGERAYTLGSDGERDFLLALETASGRELWRIGLGATHVDAISGPNSTPVVFRGLIVTISTACVMQAIDPSTRATTWKKDLAGEFSSRFAKRGGCGMSPLAAGSTVVVHTGSPDGRGLAAIDVATGRTAWTADVAASYGTASGWLDVAGGTILYHHVKQPEASGITALSAETGDVLWQIDGKEGASGIAPTAAGAGRVLLERWPHTTLYDTSTGRPLWTTTELTGQENPAVYHRGHIYGFGGQSGEFLMCVDASNGKVKWSSRIYRGHIALAGDTLVVLSASAGLLRLVAADPSAYRELSKIPVLRPGARTGTQPSIGRDHIFVRNLDEIVAVAIGS